MSRYFFHVKRGQVTVLDQEGIELANSAQAEEEEVLRAQQCLADDAWNGRPVSRGMIIVADENWRRLFEFAVLAATELADAGRKSDFATGRRAS